jgi:hypothetical protein
VRWKKKKGFTTEFAEGTEERRRETPAGMAALRVVVVWIAIVLRLRSFGALRAPRMTTFFIDGVKKTSSWLKLSV